MVASDYRKEAREKLAGKWGKAALLTLIYFAYVFVFSYIINHTSGFLNVVIPILYFIATIPVAYGWVMTLLKLFNGEDIGYFDLFTFGFNNFSRSWSVLGHILLKVLVPFVLFIVSYVLIISAITFSTVSYFTTAYYSGYASASINGTGIALLIIGFILLIVSGIWLTIKSYYYTLSYFIAIDNPEITSKEAVEESRKLMNNRRWKLFCLYFSFIGWAFLAAFTFGIGMLWLMPYVIFAFIVFYKYTLENTSSPVIKSPVEKNEE